MNWIHALRVVGLLEGVSYLLLLGVAMPLKYLAGWPLAVRWVGAGHGVLFVLFVALVLVAAVVWRFGLKWVGWALLASIIPFGTFVLDRQLSQFVKRQSTTVAPGV